MAGAVPWSVDDVAQLSGYTVEWMDAEGYYLSRRAELFHTKSLAAPRPADRLLSFPLSPEARLLSQTRLGQRLLRSLFYNALRLPDGTLFLAFAKQVAVFCGGRLIPVSGLRRAFRVLRGSAAVDGAGNVYFGEYHQNPDRQEVNVYCLPAGSTQAQIVHVFPAGEVRHVHGIFHEAQRGRLWCTTGDRGRESRICVTDDSFRTLTEVGAGDESWRCVGLSFGDNELFYGTDAEFQTNHLYRLDSRNGTRTRIDEVDGPVYYTIRRGSTHFFGTTAEGCPSQPVNAASLWCVEPGQEPVRLATWRKDRWPNVLMHGTLHFALGPPTAELPVLCYLHGLSGHDERTVCMTRGSK